MRRVGFPALLNLVVAMATAVPTGAQTKLPLPSAAAVNELPWLKQGPTPAERPKPAPARAQKSSQKSTTGTVKAAKTATPDTTKPTAKKPAKKKSKKKIVAAKILFGAKTRPANLKPRAIGFYSKGCLSGAARLPDNGKAWQAMRLSRNRHWGHPKLIALLQRFATEVQEKDNWPGLLMGDISQPRGGPMLGDHASHQVGLDADIWLTPMPNRKLTGKERENISATTMLAADKVSINKEVWQPGHVKILKRAASYRSVERILVHPAIKRELCKAAGTDRAWLGKIRPYWGHHYHFHVRIKCPGDSPTCRPQNPPSGADGCKKELTYWLKRVKPRPPSKIKPKKKKKKTKKRRAKTMADLPTECRRVLTAEPSTVEAALQRGKRGR